MNLVEAMGDVDDRYPTFADRAMNANSRSTSCCERGRGLVEDQVACVAGSARAISVVSLGDAEARDGSAEVEVDSGARRGCPRPRPGAPAS
jgi:hypothetical protein